MITIAIMLMIWKKSSAKATISWSRWSILPFSSQHPLFWTSQELRQCQTWSGFAHIKNETKTNPRLFATPENCCLALALWVYQNPVGVICMWPSVNYKMLDLKNSQWMQEKSSQKEENSFDVIYANYCTRIFSSEFWMQFLPLKILTKMCT